MRADKVDEKYRKRLASVKRGLPVVESLRWLNKGMRAATRRTHQVQFLAEWGVDNPEYFDHFLDQYFLWPTERTSFPWERGVFSSLALAENATVLDLCCGDGFNSYHFYSLRSESVTAIDFDDEAIRWARRNFKAPNLRYVRGDIRTDIPRGPFTNVVWDAAIEHFTETEISELMSSIRSVLTPDGTLSGYTIIEREDGKKSLHQHEYEFRSREDLARFLTPYFKNVQVFSTTYPTRTNLYFYATDGTIPFDRDWCLTIRQ
jgi:SAM-dependent methyltransferase